MQKIFYIVTISLCILLCSSCASTAYGTDKLVAEHSRQLAEYQATVNYYLGRVDSCAERIESIRGRADSLTGEIDRVIQLFDEYQRAVEQLLQDYQQLRNAVKAENGNLSEIDFSTIDYDSAEANRLLSLLERY